MRSRNPVLIDANDMTSRNGRTVAVPFFATTFSSVDEAGARTPMWRAPAAVTTSY